MSDRPYERPASLHIGSMVNGINVNLIKRKQPCFLDHAKKKAKYDYGDKAGMPLHILHEAREPCVQIQMGLGVTVGKNQDFIVDTCGKGFQLIGRQDQHLNNGSGSNSIRGKAPLPAVPYLDRHKDPPTAKPSRISTSLWQLAAAAAEATEPPPAAAATTAATPGSSDKVPNLLSPATISHLADKQLRSVPGLVTSQEKSNAQSIQALANKVSKHQWTRWSAHESALLKAAIAQFGAGHWTQISQLIPGWCLL